MVQWVCILPFFILVTTDLVIGSEITRGQYGLYNTILDVGVGSRSPRTVDEGVSDVKMTSFSAICIKVFMSICT